VPDERRARELFDGLAREAMLVERDPQDTELLHQRTDIRRLMLKPLSEEDPDVVRSIHRRAVAYYKGASDLAARTEGLYHRLMLGQQARTLDLYWADDLLPGLAGALDEYPPASRAYLAARSPRLGVSADDLREAELHTRRRLVHRRIEGLIAEGRVAEARQVLEEHRADTRDATPLVLDLEVQLLELSGELGEAIAVAEQGRSRAVRRGDTGAYFTFALHLARLTERTGAPLSAKSVVGEALALAATLEPTQRYSVTRLRLIVAQLALSRRTGDPVDEALADEAIALFEALPLRVVRAEPGLLRDLAAEVGSRSTRVLRAALLGVGLSPERYEDAHGGETARPATGRGDLGSQVAQALDDAETAEESPAIGYDISELYANEADEALEFLPDDPMPA
jgi:hypothetical protein